MLDDQVFSQQILHGELGYPIWFVLAAQFIYVLQVCMVLNIIRLYLTPKLFNDLLHIELLLTLPQPNERQIKCSFVRKL